MGKSLWWGTSLLVASVITSSAWAGVVLSPVDGTASDTYSGGGTPISNTFDQTGLSPTFVSGVTDWNTYFAGNPLKNYVYSNEWFTNTGVNSALVTYDLGAVFNINNFALWEEDFDRHRQHECARLLRRDQLLADIDGHRSHTNDTR